MGSFNIFIIRLLLSVILAVIISRFFFQDITVLKVTGLALVMLGFAYLFEYTKKRNREGKNGS